MSASNELLVEKIRSLSEKLISASPTEKEVIQKQITELNQKLGESTKTLTESKLLLG